MSVVDRQALFERLKREDQVHLAQAEQAERYQQQMASLPPRYQAATLDDLQQCVAQRMAYRALAQYVKTFREHRLRGDNLIFSGAVGTGKTHTACAVFKAIAEQGFRCCYTTCFQLIETIKKNFKLDLPFSEQAKPFLHADCLMIDEIPQTLTASSAGLIFQVIDERYNARKPVVLISNANEANLRVLLGEKTLDRVLTAGCSFLNFQGESLRRSQAFRACPSGKFAS